MVGHQENIVSFQVPGTRIEIMSDLKVVPDSLPSILELQTGYTSRKFFKHFLHSTITIDLQNVLTHSLPPVF